MSTEDSPTVSIALPVLGATDFTKSLVDRDTIHRTSDDGLHILRHIHQTTSKGRRRNVVSLQMSDTTDPTIKGTCTVTLDSPVGDTGQGLVCLQALQAFFSTNAGEEMILLAAGHNYG
jgi:hypothetical protein